MTSLYQHLVHALDEYEMENIIAIPCTYDDKGFSTIYKSKNEIKLPCFSKRDRIFFHRKQRLMYEALTGAVDCKKLDLVHAHLLFSHGATALRIKGIFGVPYITAVRNTDVNTFFRRMRHLRALGVCILEHAESVVFLSSEYRDEVLECYVPARLRERILAKSVVIPNGIDDYWHENRRPEPLTVPEDPIRLLSVGQINHNKNQHATVEACKRLRAQGMNVSLTIVGKPVDATLVKRIQRESFVSILPPQPMQELLPIYRAHHIFAMPSLMETFGLVYPEAMSQGLPVIYSKGQGFDGQFSEGEVGVGVRPHMIEDIVSAIKGIMSDISGISTRALEASEIFRWETIAQSYYDIYKTAIVGAGGQG